MARATFEQVQKLTDMVSRLDERLHVLTTNLGFLQNHVHTEFSALSKNMKNSFCAYERMSDKLIQMAMVNNGTSNAAASHRAQSRLEKESNSIPFGSNSQDDSQSDSQSDFWGEGESWAEGLDTMEMP